MTRRNEKRNNRHNRQRSNKTELSPFSQMLLGALLGKGMEMISKKMAEKETPDIHAEGITNKDINNINNGNATLSKLRIPADGSAVEYPIPDGLSFFFNEEGKLMVHKKQEQESAPDTKNGDPITYDDICEELFFGKTAYWVRNNKIKKGVIRYSCGDIDNYTSLAQAKRTLAFNKLQNIAKYLNKGWKPDFDDTLQEKFYIVYTGDKPESNFEVDLLKGYCVYSKINEPAYESSIYFKTFNLACEAIRLMGKESLNDLFNEDW